MNLNFMNLWDLVKFYEILADFMNFMRCGRPDTSTLDFLGTSTSDDPNVRNIFIKNINSSVVETF